MLQVLLVSLLRVQVQVLNKSFILKYKFTQIVLVSTARTTLRMRKFDKFFDAFHKCDGHDFVFSFNLDVSFRLLIL